MFGLNNGLQSPVATSCKKDYEADIKRWTTRAETYWAALEALENTEYFDTDLQAGYAVYGSLVIAAKRADQRVARLIAEQEKEAEKA